VTTILKSKDAVETKTTGSEWCLSGQVNTLRLNT